MATSVARFWPMAGFCGDRRGGGSGYVGIDVVEGVDLWGSAWWMVWVCRDRHGGGCGVMDIGFCGGHRLLWWR